MKNSGLQQVVGGMSWIDMERFEGTSLIGVAPVFEDELG